MRHILDRMMDYRAEQAETLKNNPEFTIGDVTTVNLTILSGGVQSNVVPSSLTALFDCRLAVDVDHDAFENMVNCNFITNIRFSILIDRNFNERFVLLFQLKSWCKEAGNDIDVKFVAKRPKVQPTRIDDSNPFWKAFHETLVDDL